MGLISDSIIFLTFIASLISSLYFALKKENNNIGFWISFIIMVITGVIIKYFIK